MMNTQTKRSVTALCFALALAALTGCSPKEESPAPKVAATPAASAQNDLLTQIQARGTVTIAMEGTWAPWTFHDKDGKLTGYDVAVGNRIAQKLGVKAQFIEGKWDGLLAGLNAGRYDLMINGVGITPERSKAYSFSDPYAYDRVAVIVQNDNTSIQKLEDLKDKTTANTISSTYAETAEKYGAHVIGVDDLNQTFELLRAGRIDATLNSEVTFVDYTKAHPDAKIRIALFLPEVGSIGVAIKKDASTESLRKLVNDALFEMHESGELSKLSTEFFGIDISKKDAAAK